MRSLQWRLTWSISAVLITILLGAGLLLYWAQRSALIAEFDAALNLASVTLTHLIDSDGTTVKSEMTEEQFPQFSRTDRPDCYQIIDAGGKLVEQSQITIDDIGFAQNASVSPRFGLVTLSDGRLARIVVRTCVPLFDPGDEEGDDIEEESAEWLALEASTVIAPVTLVVARDTIDFDRRLLGVAWSIGAVTLLTLVTAIAASWFVARIGLRPLYETADRITHINIDNLTSPMMARESPTEIQSIVNALNQMQGRLAAGYERERSFSADVAHELRTPIAGIRVTTEVALGKTRNAGEYQETLKRCLTIATELESIVDNLLTLSRIESGTLLPNCEPMDAVALVNKYVDRYSSLAGTRGVKIRVDLPARVSMKTDSDKLGIIFRNLVENAVSYATPQSEIIVDCTEESHSVEFRFRNEVVELQPDKLEKMFQRFWRHDRARSQTGRHSGIGLTLCRSLTEILGGQISARAVKANVIEFVLQLPN